MNILIVLIVVGVILYFPTLVTGNRVLASISTAIWLVAAAIAFSFAISAANEPQYVQYTCELIDGNYHCRPPA